MEQRIRLALRVILIGVGATLIMDIWAVIAEAVFGIPQIKFAMVGRWLGHMPGGDFTHDSIRQAAPIANELAMGWAAHYMVGILFAVCFVVTFGQRQLVRPSLAQAILFGVVTVVFPFFLLQPALGAGVMASNRPDPDFARFKSLMTHFSFGVGLYAACWIQTKIFKQATPAVTPTS